MLIEVFKDSWWRIGSPYMEVMPCYDSVSMSHGEYFNAAAFSSAMIEQPTDLWFDEVIYILVSCILCNSGACFN